MRHVSKVDALGDTHGTLNLVRKAVPAAKVQGFEQNGFGSHAVTRTGEYVSMRDALDDLPLWCGSGTVHSVVG